MSAGRAIIAGMATGSIAEAAKNHRVLSMVLIGVIVVCAVVIGVVDPGAPWTVIAQVASAVAGAALGNAIRIDLSQTVVRNQARPAARHLFDQIVRFQIMVGRAEECQASIEEDQSNGSRLDPARIGDWFGVVGAQLRNEIRATATAVGHWEDVAKDVRDAEFASYQTREQRLPGEPEGQQDGS